jgi:hypothetical protein
LLLPKYFSGSGRSRDPAQSFQVYRQNSDCLGEFEPDGDGLSRACGASRRPTVFVMSGNPIIVAMVASVTGGAFAPAAHPVRSMGAGLTTA